MRPTAQTPGAMWLSASGLLALLLLLASLQYHWLNEVREADQQKTREVLQAALDRFAEDFDRELTRAFLTLQPAGVFRPRDETPFARKVEHWRAYAPFPGLVREVLVARHGEGSELVLSRFDPAAGDFVPASWPPELAVVERRLASIPTRGWDRLFERRRRTPGGRRAGDRPRQDRHPGGHSEGHSEGHLPDDGPPGGPPPGGPPDAGPVLWIDDVPAVVMPMVAASPGLGRPGGFVVHWLDRAVITEQILPALSRQHLRLGDGTTYDVRIVSRQDGALIFSSRPLPAAAPGEVPPGDATALMFGLLPAEQLAGLRRDGEEWLAESGASAPRRGWRHGEFHRAQRLYHFLSEADAARWLAVASHPSGSLEAAITRAHRNNLAVSFGILLLLAASLLLIVISTRRQQALARQQLEFTASVTHELLTPLAAMRSAGQNLADGVVADPSQVARYGRLIDDEGRRLTHMVGQVLEFAGIQTGRREYSLRPTSPAELVDGALAEYRPMLDEKGFAIEQEVEDGLPPVMADVGALRRAFQNLIANAVKYGAGGSWIGIRARRAEAEGGPELQLSVADHGPGIASGDLSRLFEPFFRGRAGADDQIPGSGLGLALVRHVVQGHGGRVSVATAEGQGSTFTLHLPFAGDDPGAADAG